MTLDRILEEAGSTPYQDEIFQKRIRKVFAGFYAPPGIRGWLPVALCRRVGRSMFFRPRDPSRFLTDCARYGIDTHWMARHLNLKFHLDKSFWLEIRHD